VLSGRGLCDELITHLEETDRLTGASLGVIKKPHGQGGHNLHLAAVPEKIIIIIIIIVKIICITYRF
jgi:hypothetical protein